MRPKGTEIDQNALDRMIKQSGKFKTRADLCRAMGVEEGYFTRNKSLTKQTVVLVTMLLGCTEADLIKAEAPAPPPSAGQLIQYDEINKRFDNLESIIHAMRNDLATMARVDIEQRKTLAEAKAQAELNGENVQAIHSKLAEINSSVSKTYAKISKGYRNN